MNFSTSSLSAAIGATPPTTAPPDTSLAAATGTAPPIVALSDTSHTTPPPETPTAIAATTTATSSNVDLTLPSIRKSDDITPSPIRVSTLPPNRSQDPPKQQRTGTAKKATNFFLCNLTSIDPPEVKALYPIFQFGKHPAPATKDSSTTNATTDLATLTITNDNNPEDNQLITGNDDTNITTKLSSTIPTATKDPTYEGGTNPPSPTTGANTSTTLTITDPNPPNSSDKSTTKYTPSKQLDFDSTPLSSVKMAPITKRTPTTTIMKSSNKSKVVISPAAPEVRRYEKDSPATMKDPEIEIITQAPHAHKFKTVFELSIKIPKTDRVLHELSNKMTAALAFIQKYADPTAAFLPKTDATQPQILNRSTFPTVIFSLEADYFVFSSSAWHYAPKGIRGKIIRLSAIIGSDVDPEKIARCRPDLNVMNVGIDIKAHQNIDTNTRITLLGAPNTINKMEAKNLCLNIYQSALRILQTENPDDSIASTTVVPDFAIILAHPQGLQYTATDNTEEKYTPPAKE